MHKNKTTEMKTEANLIQTHRKHIANINHNNTSESLTHFDIPTRVSGNMSDESDRISLPSSLFRPDAAVYSYP